MWKKGVERRTKKQQHAAKQNRSLQLRRQQESSHDMRARATSQTASTQRELPFRTDLRSSHTFCATSSATRSTGRQLPPCRGIPVKAIKRLMNTCAWCTASTAGQVETNQGKAKCGEKHARTARMNAEGSKAKKKTNCERKRDKQKRQRSWQHQANKFCQRKAAGQEKSERESKRRDAPTGRRHTRAQTKEMIQHSGLNRAQSKTALTNR